MTRVQLLSSHAHYILANYFYYTCQSNDMGGTTATAEYNLAIWSIIHSTLTVVLVMQRWNLEQQGNGMLTTNYK